MTHGRIYVFTRPDEVPFASVIKAREVIEPALACEAALNGSEEDFAELEASIERMKGLDCAGDQDAFRKENRFFHGIIARASGNKVLEVFWETISPLAQGEHHGILYSARNQMQVIKAHERILETCRGRDAEAASIAMESHIVELEHLVRVRYEHLLKHPEMPIEPKSGRARQGGDDV